MGRKKKLKKEEIAEDWCFVCKDGGSLRICDYKDCLKSYHPECVHKDDSLLESEVPWNCDLHLCSECKKASKFYCLCCPSAVCRHCRYSADFALVRGNKGLCNFCLELVVLIEEDKDIYSNGVKVDFNAQDTAEFMFKGYWQIIKEQEGLSSEHVISAYNQLKKGKVHGSASDLSESDEEEDDVDEFEGESQLTISDIDGSNDTKKHEKSGKRKRSKGKRYSMKKQASSKKKEFIGWGSKPLLEFLASIGKDTTHELSQDDVTNIIIEYCKENNLFHPKRKKTIVCDVRLQPLLGRKLLNRNSINNRLSFHFAENLDPSEDEFGTSSEDADENELVVGRRKQRLNLVKESHSKEVVVEVQKSCFASIVPKNIRLVYLRKSLVEELSKILDTFDSKVMGSFVRVKSDPNDYLQKNSHQLVQVIGVKKTSDTKSDILLQVSNMVKDLPICKLSDDDFSLEECEDLSQRVKNGLLKRPTVVELDWKAKILHEDIIKHWIARELISLQKRIDRANEKGWRRELAEYMESLLLLQKPSEQSRLLHEVPKVIADIIQTEPANEKSLGRHEQEHSEGSPETAPRRASKDPSSNPQGNVTSCCMNDLTDAKGDRLYGDGDHNEATGLIHSCQVPIHPSPVQQPHGGEASLSTAESLVDDGLSTTKKRGQEKSKEAIDICNGSDRNESVRDDQMDEFKLAIKDMQELGLAFNDMREEMKELREQVQLTMS